MAPSPPPLLDPVQIQLQPSSDSSMIGAVHHVVEQQQPQAPEQQQQHTAIAMQQPGRGVHFASNTTDAVTHVAVQLAQAAPAAGGRRVMLNSVPSNSSMRSRVHIGSCLGSHELTDSASVISHATSTCHAKGALEERPTAQNYFQIKRNLRVSERVKAELQRFDADGDGILDVDDVTALVEHMLEENTKHRMHKAAAAGLIVFTLLLLGSMFGLTWAVVAALKDTQVSNQVLVTKAGGVVQTASYDFVLDPSGLLAPRGDNADSASPPVVRTGGYVGVPGDIGPDLDADQLKELNTIHLIDGDNEVLLRVDAVSRLRVASAPARFIVRVLTTAGTVDIDAQTVTLSQGVQQMLQGAQSTGTSGRRLLTSSAVRGYFNIYASASSKAKPPPPSPFPSPPPVPVPSPIVTGSIIWNDEFPVNTTLNSSYWTYQLGDGTAYGISGWGNGELECYTSSTANVAIVPDPADATNGLLNITAVHKQGQTCYNGAGFANSTRDWTSARIITSGKRSFVPTSTYGVRMDSRISIPMAQGAWPAFWMLPETNGPYGGWCSSGEIDIMEHVNVENVTVGTVHYGGTTSQNYVNCYQSSGTTAPLTAPGDWHVHSAIWTLGWIAWQIDGTTYYNSSSTQWTTAYPNGAAGQPFNQPFYILFNLAVGGNWPGNPTTNGPFSMLVDYVRVTSVAL